LAKTNERSFSFGLLASAALPEEAPAYVPKISLAQEQQRRTQILQAATSCFARQGYHATSMDDVVRESGLSVGAIYSYFPSKEELFLALSDARAEQTLAYLNELFRRPGPMADKTREAVDYLFDLLSDELLTLARMNLEFMSIAVTSERLKERQERRCESVRQFLRWLLTEAQRQGQVRADVEVEAAAELMMALNEGIVLLSVVGVRKVGLEELKRAYLSLLNAGLSHPTSSMFGALPAPALRSLTPLIKPLPEVEGARAPIPTNGHHTGGA
jgi:AcrR family transcriptional regulator